MSVQAISWVLEFSNSIGGPRLVLISIANHASQNGDSCWPSVKTIARESNLSERAVQYAIPILENLEELKVSRGTGRGNTHNYSLPKYQEWVQDLHLLKSKRVQSTTERVQSTPIKGEAIAPEPSLNRHLKQPKPRAQTRSARNRFDDDLEQKRRINAKTRREQRDAETRKEVKVGEWEGYKN